MTGTATISIKIIDANDETPHFTRDLFTFHLMENKAVEKCNGYLGDVAATDQDTKAEFRQMVFSIVHPSPQLHFKNDFIQQTSVRKSERYLERHSEAPFYINPYNGSFYACRPFDRETQNHYRYFVRVADRDNNNFEHLTQVMLFVSKQSCYLMISV